MKPISTMMCLVTLIGGCGASTHWVGSGVDTGDFDVVYAECRAWAHENFNPYEDFSDPLFGSLPTERRLNARIAYRALFKECMQARGYRLQDVPG